MANNIISILPVMEISPWSLDDFPKSYNQLDSLESEPWFPAFRASSLHSPPRKELAIQWLIFYCISFEILLLGCRKLSGQHECTGLLEWARGSTSEERPQGGWWGNDRHQHCLFLPSWLRNEHWMCVLDIAFLFFPPTVLGWEPCRKSQWNHGHLLSSPVCPLTYSVRQLWSEFCVDLVLAMP